MTGSRFGESGRAALSPPYDDLGYPIGTPGQVAAIGASGQELDWVNVSGIVAAPLGFQLWVDEESTVSPEDGSIIAPFTAVQTAVNYTDTHSAEYAWTVNFTPHTYLDDVTIPTGAIYTLFQTPGFLTASLYGDWVWQIDDSDSDYIGFTNLMFQSDFSITSANPTDIAYLDIQTCWFNNGSGFSVTGGGSIWVWLGGQYDPYNDPYCWIEGNVDVGPEGYIDACNYAFDGTISTKYFTFVNCELNDSITVTGVTDYAYFFNCTFGPNVGKTVNFPAAGVGSTLYIDANSKYWFDLYGWTTNAATVVVTTAVASTTTNGLMSSSDKSKLNGIAAGAAAVTSNAPNTVGTANAVGTGTSAARDDHIHAHGSQTDGTLHAGAVAGGAAGFITGANQSKLDYMATNGTTDAFVQQAVAANVGATNFFSSAPPAGLYEVDVVFIITVAATAGTAALNVIYTDTLGTQTSQIASLLATGTGRAQGQFRLASTGSGHIQWSITGITTPGSLAAQVTYTCTRKGHT